ncbi:MAG TPA: LamB/YcsF family protein [Candidatus Solibacter sp.]|jgi:UPF0271 protein|nr:LamB/YcsF family protein [Candidatus Solibacter sp.]
MVASRQVDINADVGEGLDDEILMPYLTSVSVACGGHAGDLESMARTLAAAARHQLRAGAHPSYPDRENFGRVEMAISDDELAGALLEQLTALSFVAADQGITLSHVKAHGALYNRAWRDAAVAEAVAGVVAGFNPSLAIFCPPGSAQEAAAHQARLRPIREVFLDRGYRTDGVLINRGSAGDILHDPAALPRQLSNLAELQFETMCVHGDNPAALDLLRALPDLFAERGWTPTAYSDAR